MAQERHGDEYARSGRDPKCVLSDDENVGRSLLFHQVNDWDAAVEVRPFRSPNSLEIGDYGGIFREEEI